MERPSLRTAVLGFSWLSAAEAIRVATSAFVIVYVARRLGASVFGYYAFALSVLGGLLAVVDGGLTSIGSREVARYSADLHSIVRGVLTIRLALATVAFLLLVALVVALDKPSPARLVILLSGCSLFTFALTLDWVFYGLGRSPQVALAVVVRAGVFAGLTLAFVRAEGDVWRLPLFQAAGELVAAAQLAAIYRRAEGRVPPVTVVRGSPSSVDHRRPWITVVRVRQLAEQAWPLGAGQLMRAVNFWFAVFLVSLLVGDAPAGHFAAAQRITQFALGFASLYFVGYLPVITKGFAEGPEVLRRLTKESLHMTALVTLPLAVGGSLLAVPIVRLAFGPDYLPSAASLTILMWVVPPLIFAGHFRQVLIVANRVRLDLLWVSVSAATTIVASLLLLRPFGPPGAAAAWAIAEGALWLGAWWSVRRQGLHLPVAAALPRPAAASAIMAVAVLVSRGAGLAVAVPVGVATYGIALVALGERWPAALRAGRGVRL